MEKWLNRAVLSTDIKKSVSMAGDASLFIFCRTLCGWDDRRIKGVMNHG
jgi:hypothetical protein